MGYIFGDRRFRGFEQIVKASGAETVSTTHDTVRTGHHNVASVTVDVTAAGGTTPTLIVVVEGSDDETTWTELGRIGTNGYRSGSVGTAPGNFTGAGEVVGVFPAPQYVRTRSIIGGGGGETFTYSVTVEVG